MTINGLLLLLGGIMLGVAIYWTITAGVTWFVNLIFDKKPPRG